MPRINVRITRATRAFGLVLLLVTTLTAQERHPDFGNVPLYFEENRGQTDAHARFLARSASLVGFVTPRRLDAIAKRPASLNAHRARQCEGALHSRDYRRRNNKLLPGLTINHGPSALFQCPRQQYPSRNRHCLPRQPARAGVRSGDPSRRGCEGPTASF